MNISAPIFRKLTGFDDSKTLPQTRAKLFLFFVTCVAELRNDMFPAVIKDRLYDWGYEDIDTEGIKTAFESDPEIRPSKIRKGAYEINPASKIQIKEKYKLKSLELSDYRFKVLSIPIMIISLSILIVLSLIGYHLATNNVQIKDISWTEYRAKTGFDDKKTSDELRAKYFLYFITEHIELRYDMEAKIISERLHNLGYTKATVSAIESSFKKDPDILPSNQRQNAYRINPSSIDKFTKLLDIQFPKKEYLTIGWLIKHVPISGWIKLGTIIVSIISTSFGLGALIGYLRSKNS